MTLLEQELAKLSNSALRTVAQSVTPTVAAAAQAELESRPSERQTELERLRHAVFPSQI